ncbi:phosphoribosylglycinamide formyltransferase 2 [Mycobacterium sp. 1245111.1]|nr:phosphoribosylglycinamide formyltransferase 2 [Mycobacterium sp. 1245111.1]
MLLGTGEFSRELSTALRRLGAHVIVAGQQPNANVPADESLLIDLTNADELGAAIKRARPDVVVTASDAVSTDTLAAAGDGVATQFVPSARCARLTADREGLRRLAADELGLPTAPFWFAASLDELRAIADHAGYPLRVQPVAAVGTEGQSVVLLPGDVEAAWQRAGSRRVLAETLVEIDFRVTLLTVRSDGPSGPTLDFCQPIGHGDAVGDVRESWQPQDLTPAALDAARSIAARIVKALGGRGLFGVELMVRGDEVYFNDVTALPFESGLVTLRTQRLSEFELQARAILGLPTDTIMVSPGAVGVIYAGGGGDPHPRGGGALAEALRTTESDVRVFAHDEAESRRPLGAVVVTAADVATARGRARNASAALRRLW